MVVLVVALAVVIGATLIQWFIASFSLISVELEDLGHQLSCG